jgi:lon-related putative ATP-dependent protease
MARSLPPEALRRTVDPNTLPLRSTEEHPPLAGLIGQPRAVAALEFGLDIPDQGFNIYVAGPPGVGRMTGVQMFLEARAKNQPTPPDWCYAYNFQDPSRPRALRLPPGRGRELQRDMQRLIEGVRREIPRVFESDEYNARREAILKEINQQREEILRRLNQRAMAQEMMVEVTPMGIAVIPLLGGRPITDQQFAALPPAMQELLRRRREAFEEEVKQALKEIRQLERAAQERLRRLNREVALFVVEGLMDDLFEKYRDLPEVIAYLKAVQEDIVENVDQFRSREEGAPGLPFPLPLPAFGDLALRKYTVNVLVDNAEQQGAPVIIEWNPTFPNVFGRLEKESLLGVLHTDFTLIRAGALHRANGGYLVMPVEGVLVNPFVWEGLKRALRQRAVEIEEPGERMGLLTTRTLDPEPIPLHVKVILIGSPLLYHLLYLYDEEFSELFKVKADFDIEMPWDENGMRDYIALIGTLCRKEDLCHLDAGAVARVIEYGGRLAEDQTRLSTRFAEVADLVREASFWARKAGSPLVTAEHVRQALEAKVYRSNLIEERIRQLIAEGTLLIDVEGAKVGQVNGLSVLDLGDYRFGRPNRITATVALGREGVIDIEREARLGGPIHTKGVLILSGYLASKYAQDKPLTLSARLVFEQSYSGVEGDSASCAELCALLSALADAPIRQGIAITGSINQKGELQAIGGVNEKIEGFYYTCKVKGLTGEQGVIIPEANVRNLMLREEVVEAVREGKFHIWAARTVDEAIEILTGIPAGERGPDGRYPEGTINARVDQRLREMAETLQRFGREERGERKAPEAREEGRGNAGGGNMSVE